MTQFGSLEDLCERFGACNGSRSPAMSAVRLAGYGRQWRRAWHEIGQVEWMKWFLGEVGIGIPIRASTCSEIRSAIPWTRFRRAIESHGAIVEDDPNGTA